MTHLSSLLAIAMLHLGLFAFAAEKKPRLDHHGDSLPEGALTRFGSLRLRHGDPVIFVAFLPDRRTLLSAGSDWTIRIWDASTGKEVRRFSYRIGLVEGRHSLRRPQRQDPLFVSLSANGKVLAACLMNNREIVLWDVSTGKELRRFESREPCNGVAISPDGTLTAASCIDNKVRLHGRDGKAIRTLTSAEEPAGRRRFSRTIGMAFAPDGKTVVLCGRVSNKGMEKESLLTWDTGNGQLLSRCEIDDPTGFTAPPAFSPDSKTVALATSDNEVLLLEAATGKVYRKIKSAINRPDSLVFTSDSKLLIGRGGRGGRVCMWEASSGKEIKRLEPPGTLNGFQIWMGAPRGYPGAVALSADDKVLASADGNLIRLIALDSGKEIIPSIGHHGQITRLVFHPDGGSIITTATDGTAHEWETATGKHRIRIKVPPTVTPFKLSPDRKLFAAETGEGETLLIEASSGKVLHRLGLKDVEWLSWYTFSPDGKLLAVRNLRTSVLRVFSVETGKLLATIGNVSEAYPDGAGLSPAALAFSPDGKTLAVPGLMTGLTLWDLPSRTARLSLATAKGTLIRDMAFSPDGRTFGLDMMDNRLAVYETASGLERRKYVRTEDDARKPPVSSP